MSRNGVRFLKPGVSSCNKLQTLIFEVIVHDTLIVPGDSDGPLLDLTHEALVTLGGHPCYIAICIGILSAKLVRISSEQILQSYVNWPIWATREERILRKLLSTVDFFRFSVVALLFVFFRDVLQDVLDATDG